MGGGGTSTQTSQANTQNVSVAVTTNVVGPPVNVNIPPEIFQPIASAFAGQAESLSNATTAAYRVIGDAQRIQRGQQISEPAGSSPAPAFEISPETAAYFAGALVVSLLLTRIFFGKG